MNYSYKYRLNPSQTHSDRLEWTVDTCRQVYNHFLHRLNEHDSTSAYSEQRRLPDLKDWWTELTQVHSKVLQKVVQRLYDNLTTLSRLKKNGNKVGTLNWKAPREYRSFTYSQSGFELKNTSGQTQLWLSKIGNIPIVFHRDLPDTATIKTVTIKQEPTGEWFATLGIEVDGSTAEKPDNPEHCVGIDVGILKYAHDSDGRAVGSLYLSEERDRLQREQRKLSRKEHGSNNWEQQRQKVAECHQTIKRKRHDFLHKLSNYYASEYDLVAVEDLNIKSMLESSGNSQNTASAAWNTFTSLLEYKCDREGTHFVEVDPAGTTKECASCGVATSKPLWVRKHSCPACGFEMDRDANAALNILSRGLEDVGVGYSEETPVETALPMFTASHCSDVVDTKRVIETGSPTLWEAASAAE
jgi:transposase, IS605 OrfB family, central region